MSDNATTPVVREEIWRHLTTAVLTILTCLYISICLYVFTGFGAWIRLLNWHIFLASSAFVLFIPWAILSVGSDWSIFTQSLSPNGKHLVHAVLMSLGICSAGAAVACAIIFKDKIEEPHFESIHSVVGLTTIAIMVMAFFGGILSKVFSSKYIKVFHSLLGMIMLILGLATESLGFDSDAFLLFCYRYETPGTIIGILVICISWIIVKPIINIIYRLRKDN